MKQQINVGIIGLGTVGTGALKVLIDNRDEIARKVGCPVNVIKVADLDITTERPVQFDKSILSTDVSEVLDNPEIDIVVETIGGVKPAKDFILRAMANGKHVVCANKELIAKEGADILGAACENGVDFCFEGAVGGGIPIIRPMKTCLGANKIQEVMGIVNGTTNYILTKMSNEGLDFADVLKEAQAAGYAEADPTADIEGHDAKYKLSILASIAFTSRVNVNEIYSEGITKIAAQDICYARELGYVIKLLAIAKRNGEQIEVRVHPTLIPTSHPLASVNDVYNAIYVRGDFVQDVMFYGRGAGSLPTGSAVAGDVMDIARNINHGCNGRVACTCFDKREIRSMDLVGTRYYMRLLVSDQPGVLASIAQAFGDNSVSIASMKNFRRAIDAIAQLPTVAEVSNWLRVEE